MTEVCLIEKSKVVEIVVREYGQWRNAEPKHQINDEATVIAMGALSNVLCKIYELPKK